MIFLHGCPSRRVEYGEGRMRMRNSQWRVLLIGLGIGLLLSLLLGNWLLRLIFGAGALILGLLVRGC